MVTTDTGKPLTEELSAIGESAPLMELDCKGFDPVELVFGNGWKAKSVSFLSAPYFADCLFCEM